LGKSSMRSRTTTRSNVQARGPVKLPPCHVGFNVILNKYALWLMLIIYYVHA
jgi:hypothetical protein